MIPQKMHRVQIAVPKGRADGLISALHEAGLMEIESVRTSDPEIIEELRAQLKSCSTIIRSIRKRPSSKKEAISEAMFPEPLVPSKVPLREPSEVLQASIDLTAEFRWVLDDHQRMVELRKRKKEIKELMAQIEPVLNAPARLDDIGDRYGYSLHFTRLDKDMPGFVLWSNEEAGIALTAFTGQGDMIKAEFVEFPTHPMLPAELSGSLEQELEEIGGELDDLKKKLRRSSGEMNRFLVMKEDLRVAVKRSRMASSIPETSFLQVIEGWSRQKDRSMIEELVRRTGGKASYAEFSEHEDPPTSIENPGWARPFEGMVSLYGSPGRGEIDPTVLTAATFVLTFGLMLGDAGYGLLILGASLYGWFVLGRASPTMKSASILGIELGVSTTVIGFLSGSFFGDLMQNIFGWKQLYHVEIMGIGLPADMLANVNTTMLLAIFTGVIMIYISIIVGAVNDIRSGNRKSLLLKRVSWLILLPVGILMVAIHLFEISYGPTVENMALVLTMVSLILIVVDLKLFFIFDITGMLGDVLSFIRIMALGFATVLLASALNSFSSTIGAMLPAVIGGIMVGILLIAGHVGNMGLQALGAGVHSLRLQFVEFYRRFYEGDGRKWVPFRAQRLYTKVEIEEGFR